MSGTAHTGHGVKNTHQSVCLWDLTLHVWGKQLIVRKFLLFNRKNIKVTTSVRSTQTLGNDLGDVFANKCEKRSQSVSLTPARILVKQHIWFAIAVADAHSLMAREKTRALPVKYTPLYTLSLNTVIISPNYSLVEHPRLTILLMQLLRNTSILGLLPTCCF